MLKKLDKYILKKYLGTFFFSVLLFSMIAVVIDISTKVEDFIKEEIPFTKVLTEYYINFLPYINGLLWPLFVLISVIFFTSRMAFNSEIIPMLNAGVSIRRMLRPYIIGASILAAFHLWGNHYIIPEGNKVRVDFENTYVTKRSDETQTSNIHFFLDKNNKIGVRYFRKRDTTARDFYLEKFKDKKLVYLLTAKSASWLKEEEKWRLKGFEVRTFDGINETLVRSESGETLDTMLELRPRDFTRFKNDRQKMNSSELREFIYEEKKRGKAHTKMMEIELHRRTADSFSIILLSIIGAVVSSRKVRGGMGLHLAIGAVIGALLVILSKFSVTFSTNYILPPLIGVWIPNILFSFVAVLLIYKAQE
jgi:lipopolysaccharide export system permease protein